MSDLASLTEWVQCCLVDAETINLPSALVPVTGDAGFRQYFRLSHNQPLIAVIAPPQQENNAAFVAKGLAFKAAGIRVPSIYAVDFQQGFMLLEDLGSQQFLPLLNNDTFNDMYPMAETVLHQLQKTPQNERLFPRYSEKLLQDEMALFPEWFVTRLLGLSLEESEKAMITEIFNRLSRLAQSQPQTVVHRDYHSRNLLWRDDGNLGVVDFQDAVIGPVSYDLVSLLKDCYIRWPVDMVRQRALNFLKKSPFVVAGNSVDDNQILQWFDWMGMQRHIKVLGIFARLSLRDDKPHYLQDLPLVIRYTLEVACNYPEMQPFYHWFCKRLLPVLSEQSWYQPWEQAGEAGK